MSTFCLKTGTTVEASRVATWEERFRTWAGGPGDTEHTRCENAEGMIRKAISADAELSRLRIDVFSQGSFKNVTNIPQESDVDVSVCLTGTWYYKLPDGATALDFGFNGSTFTYAPYKAAVARAIKNYFGSANVTVGNKAIRVHSNTYRVDADVVPNVLYREYFDTADQTNVREGVRFFADDGTCITNYPKQHTLWGIEKNKNTAKRFKRIARVMKSLQVDMLDKRIVMERLPSFFIESLVYNSPDGDFGNDTYARDVRAVLISIFNGTRPSDDASKWLEVNRVKYLFHSTQPWTKAQANAFAKAAWNHIGFK